MGQTHKKSNVTESGPFNLHTSIQLKITQSWKKPHQISKIQQEKENAKLK